MRISKVIKSHAAESPITLNIKRGDTIEGQEKDTKWEGWLWCRNKADVHGWVPKSFLKPLPDAGNFEVLQDYTSRELTIQEGNEVMILSEESGWAWTRTPLGEEGWIPLENLEDLRSQPNSVPDLA